MRLIAVFALALSALGGAQTRAGRKPAAPAQTTWPVESISIEGLRNYTREQVLAVLALKPGDHAGAKDFETARQRVLATGAFDSAGMKYGPGPAGKGYAVTYELSEAGPLFPMRFEDLGVPDAQLLDALKRADPLFGPKVPGTEPVLVRYTKVIETALGGNQKVVARLEPDDNQQLTIVFRSAAAPAAIARVRFTGNEVVPSFTLENAINSVAVGVPYRERRMQQLLDTQIRPIYETRGRVRVAFPKITVEPEKDVKGLVVTVAVDEGASYSLGDVDVQGATFKPAELKKLLALKTGDPFNREAVQAAAVRLENRERRDGFMHVTSKVERHIDDAAKKVNLTVRLDPGQQYTFGSLKIEGLDIISEPAVRKMWGLKPGQPFDAEYPDYFLKQIRDEGVFENLGETKAVQARDDQGRTVDVTLIFKGAPPKPKKKNPWDQQDDRPAP